MKIGGFTIIRDAVKKDYPIVEAISSILPVVDQMIVLIGESDDDTEKLIRAIPSDKIRIHHSRWNNELTTGGSVLAEETNKAFDLVGPEFDWAFYIQADECIHEQYHDAIRSAAQRFQNDRNIDGLLFRYLHFYGTYQYVGDSRRWYPKEVRIIRNDKSIRAYRDAQGFRRQGKKLRVKEIDAWVYHYGWVKDTTSFRQKIANAAELWQERTAELEAQIAHFDINEFDSLALFEGTHPEVMADRISRVNWNFQFDTSRKKMSLKNRLLQWLEKKTGIRVFEFRNYRIV